jgi:hypothetical protein
MCWFAKLIKSIKLLYFYTHFNSKIIPMKKIYLIFLFLTALASISYSQSQRMVLIEEATNASCGPCASQNPAFDILLNQNRDILTAIKYHWYFPGYDPMHNHNTVENLARVAYYNINGVPTASIDGDIPDGPTFSYPGGPHGYTQALIDEYAAIPSPFNISLSHRISDNNDSIYIDMMIEATAAVSGDLRAHMVVVEKEINFATPPGSNGEKKFLDVMKKMVPDEEGTSLPSFQPGDYIILQGVWKLANVYQINELGVVGFIQNNSSKEVHQAANSTAEPLVPLYNNELSVAAVENVSETNCLGTIEPKIVLRNQGADPLTSTTIYYHVNDETVYTYEWTGHLDFMQTEVVMLPQLGFEILEENNFYAYSVDPNGIPDEYTRNDTMVQPFERAAITPLTVKLMLRTDSNPQQITWEVLNSAGDVQYSGGPYANPNSVYNETFLLGDLECYLFKIYDSAGDGLILPGFYALYYGSGIYIKNGTTFGSVDSAFFEVNTQVGIASQEAEMNIGIFPNPAKTSVNIYFLLTENEKVSISIYDLTGRLVKKSDQGQLPAGAQEISIPSDDLKNGIYLVQTHIGQQTYSQKLTIQKQ